MANIGAVTMRETQMGRNNRNLAYHGPAANQPRHFGKGRMMASNSQSFMKKQSIISSDTDAQEAKANRPFPFLASHRVKLFEDCATCRKMSGMLFLALNP
ncbi:hypothetical protein [Novosphingobium umbonatum]|uniref:hypothetical protein n=1 Tax=Novosphingobium umbonatum TaxID=1908524 RepID=UPI0013E40932|nr:hypothetical protein [Novosphingobium umbonatum]